MLKNTYTYLLLSAALLLGACATGGGDNQAEAETPAEPVAMAAVETAPPLSAEAEKGRELAFSRKQGNCLACHQMGDADQPGNVGPALQNISSRYPNKQDVYDRIWDPMKFNPIVSMPPFGRNRILTDEQIRLITEYVYTL